MDLAGREWKERWAYGRGSWNSINYPIDFVGLTTQTSRAPQCLAQYRVAGSLYCPVVPYLREHVPSGTHSYQNRDNS